MGIEDDPYLAFCFDEACEFILSMKTTKKVVKNESVYLQEVWIKEPKWIDQEKDTVKPSNNADLIKEMQKQLDKFNKK